MISLPARVALLLFALVCLGLVGLAAVETVALEHQTDSALVDISAR